MKLVNITIPNWTKYNPRYDRKTSSWFRFQTDFFHDQKLFGCTAQQRLLFILIMCEASKSSCGAIQMSIVYAAKMIEISEQKIINDLNVLLCCGVIRQTNGMAHLPDGTTTNERTNERTEERVLSFAQTKVIAECQIDLEKIYEKYPRRVGKKKGMAIAAKQIKTNEDAENLSLAINRYREYLAANDTEARFIKHFSTFMGEWKDWLTNDTKGADSKNMDISVLLKESGEE